MGATAQSTPISSYTYTLGPAGNRTSVAELSGRTVNYGYDSLYRLTSESISADPHSKNGTVGYTYDSVGNRQQMSSTLSAVPGGLFDYNGSCTRAESKAGLYQRLKNPRIFSSSGMTSKIVFF
jgi:hypothetical protein